MTKKMTKREKKLFMACVILVFVYAGYNGLVRPMKNRIVSADEEILAYQKRLSEDTRTVRKSQKLRRRYGEYLDRFKQSKTDGQVMASVLSEIEEVTNELGIPVSELKPNKVKHDKYYNKFSVSLVIDGDLISILHFLHTLQGQPHFFDFEEMRLSKTSKGKAMALRANFILSKILMLPLKEGSDSL